MPISQNPRSWIVRIMFVIMAVVLISRLFTLQVVDDKYKILAEDQAIFRKVIYPARGSIVDRLGKELLYNAVSFDLMVTPNKINPTMDSVLLCNILELSKEDFKNKMHKIETRNNKIKQSVFQPELTVKMNAQLQENIYLFPGFELLERTTRTYPKSVGALTLGYLSEISPSMLLEPRYSSYRQGDYVGMSGLESVYEEELRGQRGVQYLVRDVLNRPRDSYKDGEMDTAAIGGQKLELYLDGDLQAYGEKLMSGKIGSVVAIDPKTGGILAMVSAPTYDPNLLTGANKSNNYAALTNLPTRPMFNRATQATYPPGSTFKPITALTALDVGAITPDFGLTCNGGYYACGRRIGCTHSGGGHSANLKNALANSCNSYFLDLFRKVVDYKGFKNKAEGLTVWHDYMSKFGFGHPIGVDITAEKGGFIPDTSYFNKAYGSAKGWNSCTMVFVGMGQGEVTLTPLQLANSMALIANKGYYYTPHFVRSIGNNPKHEKLKPYLEKHTPLHINNHDFQVVIDGMEQVVTNGTGRVAKLPGIAVCAKTGTVENYALIMGKKVKLDNHSVFVCFAPKDDPKIAIAVVVANSGYGATWAGPVASLMMEKYLTDSVKRKPLEERMFNANLIKNYTYVLDSLDRMKDKLRWEMKMADKTTKDMLKKRGDTLMVDNMIQNFYRIKG